MSTNPQQPTEDVAPAAGTPRWMAALLVVLALLLGFVAYAQWSTGKQLAAQLEQANQKLAQLDARAGTLENNYADLKGQLDVTGEKLGLTQSELARARAMAAQLKEEQKRTAAELSTELKEQEAQLGTLSGEVGTVKTDVATTKQELQQTQSKLERTIGDLGLQSGLIARNYDELQELKRRGERDYFEFDLKKSKQYTRIGLVSVRLNKTDTKRQKFTVTLLANDKVIEKKDKTLLEPVQFYMAGTRHLLELVVYEVNKDRVVGYLSVPKEVAARQ
jgi:chromosome segregation ATPase